MNNSQQLPNYAGTTSPGGSSTAASQIDQYNKVKQRLLAVAGTGKNASNLRAQLSAQLASMPKAPIGNVSTPPAWQLPHAPAAGNGMPAPGTPPTGSSTVWTPPPKLASPAPYNAQAAQAAALRAPNAQSHLMAAPQNQSGMAPPAVPGMAPPQGMPPQPPGVMPQGMQPPGVMPPPQGLQQLPPGMQGTQPPPSTRG